MPQAAIYNGKSIDRYIPPHLRDIFYRNPTRPYARNNGLGQYDFFTEGLVLYLPLWALKGSAFKSVDADRFTFDVTGALWSPQGRVCDGDDFIQALVPNFRSGDSSGSIEGWFKSSDKTNFQELFEASDTATNTHRLQVRLLQTSGRFGIFWQDGGGAESPQVNEDFVDGNWHHWVLSSSGTAYSIFIDGVSKAISGTNNGNWFSDITGVDSISLGAAIGSTTVSFLIGTIDETRVYSSPLTLAQAQHNRNVTIWRYQ